MRAFLAALALFPALLLAQALGSCDARGEAAPEETAPPAVSTLCAGDGVRARTRIGGVRPGSVVVGDVTQRIRIGDGEVPPQGLEQECEPMSPEERERLKEKLLEALGLDPR